MHKIIIARNINIDILIDCSYMLIFEFKHNDFVSEIDEN